VAFVPQGDKLDKPGSRGGSGEPDELQDGAARQATVASGEKMGKLTPSQHDGTIGTRDTRPPDPLSVRATRHAGPENPVLRQ